MADQTVNQSPSGRYGTVALLAMAGFVLLVLDTVFRGRGEFDYRLINAVRAVEFSHDRAIMERAATLTSAEWTLGVLLLVVVVFVALRAWALLLALGAIPFAAAATWAVQGLVDRGGPEASRIEGLTGSHVVGSFPSGHVVLAVVLYGVLFALAGRLTNRAARVAGRAACLLVIVLAGLSRVWLGSHWVSDVAAGYLLGGAVLCVALVLSRRAEPHIQGVPLIHARSLPHDEAKPHAHALTSLIHFRGAEVWKVYAPGLLPQAVYWLSFQAPFPYSSSPAALLAAIHRRNLALRLTEFWYGEPRVARAIRVDRLDGRPAVVDEFIPGDEPSRESAEPFLHDLAQRFDDAGLPTWQIDPRQPRSFGNLIETPDGKLVVIDLESGLVSPLASLRAWKRAIGRRVVPMFDDVYFDITREYVSSHADEMQEKMGADWVEAFQHDLDMAEQDTIAWHAAEPRIWARALGWLYTGFGVRRWPARVRRRADAGRERATDWLESAIERWEREGRLTSQEARRLRGGIEKPEFQAVLPHFGVHLMIGVVLRFPFGSIVRFSYTSINMLLATLLLLARRRSREQWKRSLSIHSPLVLLVSGLPGVGTFAYLTSKPVRSQGQVGRIALDAAGEKIPLRLYRRSGLRRILAGKDEAESSPVPKSRPREVAGQPKG